MTPKNITIVSNGTVHALAVAPRSTPADVRRQHHPVLWS